VEDEGNWVPRLGYLDVRVTFYKLEGVGRLDSSNHNYSYIQKHPFKNEHDSYLNFRSFIKKIMQTAVLYRYT
jgi:hypothetical protein